jgi:hypothetical protein
MALGSTQPLTEMSIRNLSGGKGRPARKADKFSDCIEKCVRFDVSQPYWPPIYVIQNPAIGPYPEPDVSSSRSVILFL